MGHEEHKRLLEEVLAEFKKRGLKVIRLEKKTPDAIVVMNNEVMGIEVTSGSHHKVFQRKTAYEKLGFDFDSILIIGNTAMKEYGVDKYTPPKAYFVALELKKRGLKLKDIQKILKKEFDVNVSIPTLSNWTTGKSKPYLVKNLTE